MVIEGLEFVYRPQDIVKGIFNLSDNNFDHKIELITDAAIELSSEMSQRNKLDFFKNITEENLNIKSGISMYMKNMQVTFDGPETAVSSEDFYNILGPRK